MQNSENTTARSLKSYLYKKDSPLSDLYKKAQRIQEIDHKLKNHLDPSLRNHFELANIDTDVVVILVNNSAWATRLRYNIPAILDTINNQLNFKTVKTVRIKVKHLVTDNSNSVKHSIHLSKNTALFLEDAAQTISDSELSNCFLKLSKNHL